MEEVVFATARASRQRSPQCQPMLCRCVCAGSGSWEGTQPCWLLAELCAQAQARAPVWLISREGTVLTRSSSGAVCW